MSEPAKNIPAKPRLIVSYSVERDGMLPGQLPAYRVVTVTVDGTKAKVERSAQKYLLPEALSIVEDKAREGLQL